MPSGKRHSSFFHETHATPSLDFDIGACTPKSSLACWPRALNPRALASHLEFSRPYIYAHPTVIPHRYPPSSARVFCVAEEGG